MSHAEDLFKCVLAICMFYLSVSLWFFLCVCVSVFEPVQIIYYVPLPFLQMVTFVVAIQSLSHVWFFMTPWTAARQASLSFTMSRSLLKLMSIELMMPSNQPILCRYVYTFCCNFWNVDDRRGQFEGFCWGAEDDFENCLARAVRFSRENIGLGTQSSGFGIWSILCILWA